MIGVINPSANETLDLQMEYLANATLQLVPGENFPTEGSTTTSAVPTATSTPSAPPSNTNNGGSSGLGPGPIAGIAIGGAAVVILAAALIYLCGRRGGLDEACRRSAHMFPPAQMVDAQYRESQEPRPDHLLDKSLFCAAGPGPVQEPDPEPAAGPVLAAGLASSESASLGLQYVPEHNPRHD